MKARRIGLWAAVVGVAAVAILFAEPALGGIGATFAAVVAPPDSGKQVVDVSAPVTQSSCAPCHQRIADGLKPGIVFHHATHLSFQCVACHAGNPHAGGTTVTPPMQLCFNCHGVKHGPQGELASSNCRDCHTASFNLRPANHGRDFAGTPHVTATKASGVNACMMCHVGTKDCDACHKSKHVKVGPMPATYHAIYRVPPKAPSVKFYPDKPTTMGQCIQCHPDIDSFMPGKVIFQHAVHLQRNYPCEACHPTFGHDGTKIARPTMQSCYRCHGLSHAGAGQVATVACQKCHPKGFQLKPPDHTAAFAQLDHGKRAAADGAYCAMCHQLTFCKDCHTGKKVGSWMTPGQKVVPGDHRLTTWNINHGKLFLQDKGLCGSCHDTASCTTCHKTPMPHPNGWLADHHAKGIDASDCNICHVNRDACQQCHHDKVKDAALTAANCVGCHKEMKQTPATSIQNRAFAEHAVHFQVAKVKGEPYHCDDCHVDFGSSAKAQQIQKQQGHDLNLCYGCHGALDIQSKQIAPWPGAQLCRRCHKNFNF